MPLVTSSTRFAPVSAEPSLRVRLVSWYFTIGGGLRLASIGIVLWVTLSTPALRRPGGVSLFAIVALLASGVGSLWTGWAIAERKRLGLLVGIASFATPLVAALAGQFISRGGVIFCLVGLGLIASVWREVSDASDRAEHDRD